MVVKNAQNILDFWFKESLAEELFRKKDSFDQKIRDKFFNDYEKAITNEYDDWQDEPKYCLALIILLDQFTRNIFRQSARAFSGDEMALAISLRCVDRGYLDVVGEPSSRFMLMPMMHSEDLKIQKA